MCVDEKKKQRHDAHRPKIPKSKGQRKKHSNPYNEAKPNGRKKKKNTHSQNEFLIVVKRNIKNLLPR